MGGTPGFGGQFTGGTGYSDSISGGVGVYVVGGTSGASSAGDAGTGVMAFGGYSGSGDGETGGLFYGGSSNTGYAGSGLYAIAGYSSSNGYGPFAAEFNGSVDINGTVHSNVVTTKIDHPIDPANKYLNLSAIQSPRWSISTPAT